MATETSVSFGSFRLDPQNACVWRDADMIKLTPKAFAVLHYLIERPGRLVTKDELFTALWPDTVVSDVALSVCIRELRKSLEDEAKTPQYIETVHRRGFRFIAAVTAAPVSSDKFRVPSQEEENQKPVLSVVEGKTGDSSLESRVQSLASENHNSSPQPVQTLDLKHQTLGDTTPDRSWPRRNLAWLGVVLLASAGVFLFYFFSSHIPQSEIRNQGEVASPLPLPDKPSIIVLPFVNLSGDPAQEYFSDGVTEEITATLSRVSGLFVIARTSAFTYKGKAAKVQDISREMGVRYVLEGSVQKADGQVRIIAQLIDATTGKHLWSEHYDRPLQNIFALQDEIRQQITLALQVRLALEEPGRSQRAPTTNL